MRKIILATLIGSIFGLSSCSKQPNCSEEIVKTTAYELAEELVLTDVAFEEFVNKYQYGNFFQIQLQGIELVQTVYFKK